MHKDEIIARIKENAGETARAINAFMAGNAAQTLEIAKVTVKALYNGNKVICMGNGGSAADSQHLVAEFVGRFLAERTPLAAIALSVNTSILTAVGNDYGYDEVFSRQVRALAKPGDVVIGISTSGNSPNVVRALEAASALGCVTVGLTGEKGGTIAKIADHSFLTPTTFTPRIQECHITWIHAYCDLVEKIYMLGEGADLG